MRGMAWTVGGYGAAQVVRLVSTLILTRLLFPEIFGLMALVNVVIQGFQLFSDIGLGPSIIQNKRGGEPIFLDTAWTLQIIRGLVLGACSGVFAWPIARFYGDPRLIWLLPAVGMNAVVAGFYSTALLRFHRDMSLGSFTMQQLAAQVLGLAVSVALAWRAGNIWAIVVGGWATSVTQLILSHAFNPGPRNRLRWEGQARAAILGFGRWIFVSTILTFLSMQADRLILGRLVPLATLGAYNIAYTISDVPRNLLSRAGAFVIFPAISRKTALPRAELRVIILKHRRPMLIGMAAMVAVLIGLGDRLILALFDPRYAQGAWIMPILALGLWPRVLDQALSGSLLAIGQLRYNPLGSILRLMLVLFGLPLAYKAHGLTGVAAVVALGDVPNYAADAYGCWRHGLDGFRQDAWSTALMLAILAVLLGARFMLDLGSPFAGA